MLASQAWKKRSPIAVDSKGTFEETVPSMEDEQSIYVWKLSFTKQYIAGLYH